MRTCETTVCLYILTAGSQSCGAFARIRLARAATLPPFAFPLRPSSPPRTRRARRPARKEKPETPRRAAAHTRVGALPLGHAARSPTGTLVAGHTSTAGLGMSRHKGSFVYTGSGKKQSDEAPPEQRLCTQEACAIQRCLARNNHQQSRCEEAIEGWQVRAGLKEARCPSPTSSSPTHPHNTPAMLESPPLCTGSDAAAALASRTAYRS